MLWCLQNVRATDNVMNANGCKLHVFTQNLDHKIIQQNIRWHFPTMDWYSGYVLESQPRGEYSHINAAPFKWNSVLSSPCPQQPTFACTLEPLLMTNHKPGTQLTTIPLTFSLNLQNTQRKLVFTPQLLQIWNGDSEGFNNLLMAIWLLSVGAGIWPLVGSRS